MARTLLEEFGDRGYRVRVFAEGRRIVARWYEGPVGRKAPRQQSWPNRAEFRAVAGHFAEAMAAHLEEQATGAAVVVPTQAAAERAATAITTADLWERYRADQWAHLRPNTRRNYEEQWRRWEQWIGPHTLAASVRRDRLPRFREHLEGQGLRLSVVRATIKQVQRVYRWADDEEILPPTRIPGWRFRVPKDRLREFESPPEYSREEFEAILAQLDPTSPTQWRPWVALTLCGLQGARQHAVLHLQWADINFADDVIHWRLEWDKTGKDWYQPLRARSREAIVVAYWHRRRMRYEGPWLLPAGSRKNRRSETYSIQSLWAALKRAEARAGVERIRGRAGHGNRRLVATDLADVTGNPVLAMQAIGDDVRQATRYIKRRDSRIREAFELLDREAETPRAG